MMGEESTTYNIETIRHIEKVRNYIAIVMFELMYRQSEHDQSKLLEPEKSVFDEYTPKLKNSTYGSDEYKSFLAGMKPALDHHYKCNQHHPEHYSLWKCPICQSVFREEDAPESECYNNKPRFCPKCVPHGSMFEATLEPYIGLNGMSLIDLIEMLCDWFAATQRHNDGNILRSIELNQKRFNYSDELKQIFINTVGIFNGTNR